LAPAGIGARNSNLEVSRLRVWRDIYYIADSSETNFRRDAVVSDFANASDHWNQLMSLPYDPSLWPLLKQRQHVEFPLGENQFFVMGDNSAESSDARLWSDLDPRSGGKPGGAYLERDLLIGKALCVYWPHSWNRIPGTPIPFPLFPNFMDMRLVR
jgi:signal peptidase I